MHDMSDAITRQGVEIFGRNAASRFFSMRLCVWWCEDVDYLLNTSFRSLISERKFMPAWALLSRTACNKVNSYNTTCISVVCCYAKASLQNPLLFHYDCCTSTYFALQYITFEMYRRQWVEVRFWSKSIVRSARTLTYIVLHTSLLDILTWEHTTINHTVHTDWVQAFSLIQSQIQSEKTHTNFVHYLLAP